MDLDKEEFRRDFGEPPKDLLVDFDTFDEAVHVEKSPLGFSDDKAPSKLSELIFHNDSEDDASPEERVVGERAVTKSELLGDDELSIERKPAVAASAAVDDDRRGTERFDDGVRGSSVRSNATFENYGDFESQDRKDRGKDTKIESDLLQFTPRAAEKAPSPKTPTSAEADHVNRRAAMEAAGTEASSASNECCPFSPGVWFNPDKLHPKVADHVYWRDPKKTGVLFAGGLVLLLSLKCYSLISVLAYATLAVLSLTVSFRIYKNVLQSVKKSNEGHPFKDYLDMDLNFSSAKLGENTEVLIHHFNGVLVSLRSLVLVEDLFDTIKLILLAWCFTYVGAWFDGMTMVILCFVSAFTLPKLYETNKTQIDTYAELIHVRGKELMETINSKIPLGKKKNE